MNPTYAPLKLVVSGPVGAGKTTFIRSLSTIDVIETEETTDEAIGKRRTTVALDFGLLEVGDAVLHIYGTPGQDRFDFMWEILCEGALGLILLVSGERPEDYPHARRILERVTSRVAVPFILGVTHQDAPRVWEPEDVAAYFDVEPDLVIGLDATDREQALGALAQMLAYIDRCETGGATYPDAASTPRRPQPVGGPT